ncbi:recombinase family protein [uncultured Herbaspirillum sp.]|uniref:recombinase family protein n=1 Tax=uncultured Herbaspirillum sp. TaxID=160236 RepID=UPI00260C5117|nr:recombinase family protein [uncultured Herbaspirillum sp.]
MTNQSKKPMAYSYVRFSAARQAYGDSLRRQVEATEKYCRDNGLELLPQNSYKDLGVSAFKRRNIEKGALASFLQAVKGGQIAKGSYLIIEQFDRLSRADVGTALRLFLDLTHEGIKIVTLSDGKVWDRSSNNDTMALMTAIVFMARAHDESAAKAARLAAVWGRKKAEAGKRLVTAECPRWLLVNSDRTGFVVRKEMVESIGKVFSMRIEGYGVAAIVSRANAEKWPVPGKPPARRAAETDEEFSARRARSPDATWHNSLVTRLLANRALLGEYQPRRVDPEGGWQRIDVGDPFIGYYPAVLDESTFLRAQAVSSRRGRFPGRRDSHMRNWLYGLVDCKCGQSLVRKNKTSSKQEGYSRYYCSARIRGVSRCASVSTSELEDAVLYVASSMLPRIHGSVPVAKLRAEAEVLEVKISEIKQKIERQAESIGATEQSAVRAALLAAMERDGTLLTQYERELATINGTLADWSGMSGYEVVSEIEQINTRLSRMATGADGANGPALLREELARVVSKITVYQEEDYISVQFKGRGEPVWLPFNQVRGEAPAEHPDVDWPSESQGKSSG